MSEYNLRAEVRALADEFMRDEAFHRDNGTAGTLTLVQAASALRALLASDAQPEPGPGTLAEARCWRGECQTTCYYPETCSERTTLGADS